MGTLHTGFHTPTIYFTPDMRLRSAQCSCSAGYGCEHAAALLLDAAQVPEPAMANASAGWQRSLDTLLAGDGLGEEPAAAPARAPSPLALEFSLQPGLRGTQRVLARLLRRGKNGGWIYGSLSWHKLDTINHQGNHVPEHVDLLRELFALHPDRERGYYYYGDDRFLDVSDFQSQRLWALLAEAGQAGLGLLHAGSRSPLSVSETAELAVDVTADSAGDLTIAPVVRVGDEPVTPAGYIGAPAHGVAYPAGRTEPFRLARLVTGPLAGPRPSAQPLLDMAAAAGHLRVPASEAADFERAYYPRLRRAATVLSSDGSFTAPQVGGPALHLTASYGDDHALEVSWEWLYRVGDAILPAAEASLYRDKAAEQAILDTLPPGTGPGYRARLSGLDTMRFTTETLPLLRDRDGITIDLDGTPADYRETTAVIGISTRERPGETDWFDLGVTIEADGREVPFAPVFTALARGESHLLLSDGTFFSLEKPELQALQKLIDEAKTLQEREGPLGISRFQAGLWEELAALGVVTRQANTWQRQVQGLLQITELPRPEPPSGLDATLRPYQLDGFGWLAFLWEHQLGGILADDMGLGKTLQTLALIGHAASDKPFLIVAPTSVVPNWAAEARKFAPGLRVATITSRAQRIESVAKAADAVVTSYTLLRLDFEEYKDQAWAGMLLDEAQYVKNHQAQTYQCARKLPAAVKIAITGTPMENNLMELWSLLSITAPGLFPNPARFKEYYVQPIEKRGDRELLAQLKRRVRPLILRRTKEQVAKDLPPKQEQVLEVELHARHKKIYQTHLQRERQKVLGLIGDLNANRFTILRSLTLLRQLSLHPALVDTAHGDIPCAKLDALIDQIYDVAAGGHRALVFSQFTGFLSLVRIRLAAAGIPYCYLDGSTRDRAGVLAAFKDGTAPVFLISLKAGGFGLNLTEADYCFLLDPWWNPATEAQAIDRTHRIGQTRNVMVYRLIAKDTIEEKVLALQQRKAELFASVLDDGEAFGGALTVEDIKTLMS